MRDGIKTSPLSHLCVSMCVLNSHARVKLMLSDGEHAWGLYSVCIGMGFLKSAAQVPYYSEDIYDASPRCV